VLFAGAEGARSLLPEALGADVVVVYRTLELAPPDWPECDLVLVVSPSAARALARVSPGARVVSIGPETTRAAAAAGLVVSAEAEMPDADGLVGAVERAAAS
jgi:uroporphyrinogen-III synthase